MHISGFHNNTYIASGKQSIGVNPQNQPTHTGIEQDSVTLSTDAEAALERLAMYPDWAGSYLPSTSRLSDDLGNHTLGKAAAYDNFRSAHHNELSEYNEKFKTLYQESKAEHRIVTPDDHFRKVLTASQEASEFKHTFESKITGDPRMLELMNILGIKLPE